MNDVHPEEIVDFLNLAFNNVDPRLDRSALVLGMTDNLSINYSQYPDDLLTKAHAAAAKQGKGVIVRVIAKAIENRCKDQQTLTVMARSKKNATKYIDLYNGNWQPYYNDEWKAALGFCWAVLFYTADVRRTERLFKFSKLYPLVQERWDYRKTHPNERLKQARSLALNAPSPRLRNFWKDQATAYEKEGNTIRAQESTGQFILSKMVNEMTSFYQSVI